MNNITYGMRNPVFEVFLRQPQNQGANGRAQNQPPSITDRVMVLAGGIFFVCAAVSTFSIALPALASSSWLVFGMGAVSMAGSLQDGYVGCRLAWTSVCDLLGCDLSDGFEPEYFGDTVGAVPCNLSLFVRLFRLIGSYNGCYTALTVLSSLRGRGVFYFVIPACITYGVESCFYAASLIEKLVSSGNYVDGLRLATFNNALVASVRPYVKLHGWIQMMGG